MANTWRRGRGEKDVAPVFPVLVRRARAALTAAAGALVGQFLRLVDQGIPRDFGTQDPDTQRRARIILGFTLFLIVLGVETGLFFAWILEREASLRVQLALLLALGLTLLIPLSFRRLRSLAVGANLVLVAAFIVTVTIFTVIGGIKAPLIHWLALLPMLAALMGARTSVWVWTAISLATLVVFIAADAWNHVFVDAVGFAQLAGSALWFQRFVNLCSWLGILLAVALLYEDQKNRQTSQLTAKNAELEAQIAQRYKAEQLSEYLAYYDELTGLPNRRLFTEQLDAAVTQTARLDRMLALLFLDLDSFKEVNDLHGHGLGDQLLQQVAGRLQACVRRSDRVSRDAADGRGEEVARLGGDEFTILLTGIRGHHDAAVVAQRILDRLTEPFLLGDLALYIGTSIGIAVYSEGEVAGGDLLRNADLAMYRAKSAGKNNFKFHDESMNAEIALRNRMSEALRKALDGGEMALHFQSIVAAGTGATAGVEALLRWERPGEAPVSTEAVIELAEESGLITPLGNWVIREACRRYREWSAAGLEVGRVAVNVSAEQFRRGGVVDTIRSALEEFGVPPGRLEVEITEGAMMVDEDRALRDLRALKALGVSIALDDFGTGYSSLSYVHRFPVDAVKIDRSFVAGVADDESSRAITMAVIALANQLGIRVVGEGVENAAQADFLVARGCDELQGFLYSTPQPAGEMRALLLREQATRAGLAL